MHIPLICFRADHDSNLYEYIICDHDKASGCPIPSELLVDLKK